MKKAAIFVAFVVLAASACATAGPGTTTTTSTSASTTTAPANTIVVHRSIPMECVLQIASEHEIGMHWYPTMAVELEYPNSVPAGGSISIKLKAEIPYVFTPVDNSASWNIRLLVHNTTVSDPQDRSGHTTVATRSNAVLEATWNVTAAPGASSVTFSGPYNPNIVFPASTNSGCYQLGGDDPTYTISVV